MFKRVELHNHTTESDGNLKVEELLDFMIDNDVSAIAITDHNTISGHEKAEEIIEKNNLFIEIIKGVEFTTYYGHILCLNMKEYFNWDDINYNNPENIFDKIHDRKGLVGIAHPFSEGFPLSQGCEWIMKVNDYSKVDFIEVINNSQSLEKVNKKAIDMWQNLVFKGENLAITTGMDLHGKCSLNNRFNTYIEQYENQSIEEALYYAINNQRTFIGKNMILDCYLDYSNEEVNEFKKGSNDRSNINSVSYGYEDNWTDSIKIRCKIHFFEDVIEEDKIMIVIEGKTFKISSMYTEDMKISFRRNRIKENDVLILKAYYKEEKIENLLAIAPCIYV